MILYVLKSSLSLLVLFGFYKLFLENQKLHQFNRFYLLCSLSFSLAIPFLSVEVQSDLVPVIESQPIHTVEHSVVARLETNELPHQSAYSLSDALALVYWLVTSMLLIRFVRNIDSLIRTIDQHPKVFYQDITIVLLSEKCLPYTFLHYLFVSETDYEKQLIERELLTHELVHIKQKHSFDILFIELIISFFWINPVLIFIKRAVRLNHEFLADQFVNNQYQDVVCYQRLLLSKLTGDLPIYLTSNLMFQATKQRFIMMNKQTSQTRALITSGSVVVLFALLTVVFCVKSVAQSAEMPAQAKPRTNAGQPKPKTDPKRLELQYKDKLVIIPSGSTQVVRKKFSDLSEGEKKNVIFIAPQPRKTPSKSQFEEWKNPNMFGIWIDGKHVKNGALNAYKASDIASFSGSYIHKNARQPQGYLYQMDLMTHKEYERYLKESVDSPFLIVMRDKPGRR